MPPVQVVAAYRFVDLDDGPALHEPRPQAALDADLEGVAA